MSDDRPGAEVPPRPQDAVVHPPETAAASEAEWGSDSMTELLRSAGVDDADIIEAREHGHIGLLALENLVIADPADHDLMEVAVATGLSPAMIARLWRSLGFAEPRPNDRIFTDVDLDMLSATGRLVDLGIIDDELTVQMARVIGSSLSRVATALIDSVAPGDSPPEVGEDDFAQVAPVLLPMLLQVMDYVWRRHVQVAARARISRQHSDADPSHQVVGFADLVGFTALSQQIGPHELAEVVDRFETIAYDTVGLGGGRVVKMIGDEVMFSVGHERAAAEIALALSEGYRDDDELSDVRVGLAAGPVLQRDADLFGPVVNRASRIVNLAFPGTVVCDDVVSKALEVDVDITRKAIGTRNLKDIGRVSLFVLRRASVPMPERDSRQRAEARRASRREARVNQMQERHGSRRGDRSEDRETHDGEPPTR